MSLSLVCVALATMGVAPAELKNAEALMAKYKYAEAQAALKKARTAKGLDRASLLRILELQGIAAGQQRQAGPAKDAFTELLVLDPNHKLGEDFAPRVSTPFLEASSSVSETGALEIKQLLPTARDGRVVALNIEVPKDPLKHVRSLVFHVLVGGTWQTRAATLEGGKASVNVEQSAEVQWWVELFGDNEAQLVLLGTESAPLVATPPTPMVSATPPPPPSPGVDPMVGKAVSTGGGVRTASYFVVGGAAVAAGVGAYFGIRSSSELASINGATRDAEGRITGITEREAQARGAQAAADGTVANIMFVGAGTLAAAGVVMFIVGGPETSTKVSIAPSPGGAMVSGSFP